MYEKGYIQAIHHDMNNKEYFIIWNVMENII